LSQTQYVQYRSGGFWAYDVALAIFLKHLIDVSVPRAVAPGSQWLSEAISWWRVVAAIHDYGLEIDKAWSASQIDTFIDLANRACNLLAERDRITADEITAWKILDELRIFPRGATEVLTAPVVELGRAIIALVNGTLPAAPSGRAWFYGTPDGRDTIRMQQ